MMKIFNDENIVFEKLDLSFKDKIIFLDIDGTLIPDGADLNFSPEILNKIGLLKKNNQVFLCTNTRDKIRNSKIKSLLGLPIISEKYRKPDYRIIDGLEIDVTKNKLVIGDKFLTDGLFAKNIRAEFLKVRRKISGDEPFFIRLINFIDDVLCLIFFQKRNI